VLELLGQHAEAAQIARDGLELALRAGLARTFGSYLIGNQAEPLLRLGEWAEVDRLISAALTELPEGVFGATLEELRTELAALRGHYDEAARRLRDARRLVGDTIDVQFTQPLRFSEAMIALGRGDLAAARAAVAAGLAGTPVSWAARYAWPLVWLGLRIEADEATRYRDRREPVPPAVTERVAELTGLAGQLPTPAPPARGYQALAAAERARADGAGGEAAWAAAVAAWRAAAEPYPLSYALLRRAETATAGGDRDAATAAVNEARQLAESIGAGPIATEAGALIRRARLDPRRSAAEGAEETDGSTGNAKGSADDAAGPDELARFGLTEREREVLRLLAAGQSNPEIARVLFISAKTASVHVSNILAKLGVSGRVEAAAVAHRLGLAPSFPAEPSSS
jgi:DNA-binding CsgD family transcriptional regulator